MGYQIPIRSVCLSDPFIGPTSASRFVTPYLTELGRPNFLINLERMLKYSFIGKQDQDLFAMFCLRAWVPLLFLPTNASPVSVFPFPPP